LSNNRKLTVIFVAAYERVTYALNVAEFLANHQINFPEEFTLSAHLHPLSELHGSFEESGVFATLDIILAARAHGDSWVLDVDQVREVQQPRKRQRRQEAEQEQESDCASESSSGMSEAAAVRNQSSGSSCRESCQSVDSDIDSEVPSGEDDAGDEFSEVGEDDEQEWGFQGTSRQTRGKSWPR